MSYLSKVFTKKQILWLILSGGALLLFLIILFIGVKCAGTQDAQSGADRWDPEGESAQISVFYSELAAVTEDNIKELNFNIDTALETESLLSSDPSVRKRISAYCAQTEGTLDSETASQEAKILGVGGDFFQFHPLRLLAGAYFSGDDLMQDHILIDHETAWKLYGSDDIVGQVVEISGKRYVISGVYERESSRLSKLAGNNEETAYISYTAMKNDLGVEDISCFETIMPEPVDGFALKTVTSNVSLEENRFEILENSTRFHWISLLKDMKNLSTRSMSSKSIVFPYWENMARGLEDKLMPLVALDLLLFIFVVVNLIVLLIRMWVRREIRLKDIRDYIEERVDARRKRKREMENPEGGEYL